LDPHPHSLRALDDLLAYAGHYRPPEEVRRDEFEWVRLAIVLKLGNQRVGVWLLGRRDPDDYYPQRDIALLSRLGNQIAPVLENIRLFDETRTAAHQFSLLYEAGLALNTVLKPHDQLQFLLELAMKTLHADRAAFFALNASHNELEFESGVGFDRPVAEKLENRRYPVGDKGALVGWVAKNRLPINVPDVRTNPLWLNLDPGISSGLWTPVERKKELRGVMAIYSTRRNAFATQDERLLMLFANQAAVALENARLFEAEKTRREELGGLYDLSRALADAAFDSETILNLIARRAVETIHSTFVRVLLLDKGEWVTRAGHLAQTVEGDLRIGRREPVAAHPLLAQVLSQNQMQIAYAYSASLSAYECESIFLGLAESACLVPLVAGQSEMGLIIIGESRQRAREPFSQEKLSLARSIGDLTISALHQAELYGELEQAYLQTVLTLAQAVDAKDTYTADHALRLAEMATAVGRELGMTSRELEDLRYGAILHDIGKIGVRDDVLQKPGTLNAEERMIMQQHPVIGAHILLPVPRLANAALIVKHHHERYDGTGYPDGLAHDEIPLGARILTVVDSYSAIMDERVYKSARTQAEAMDEIMRNTGAQFDPRLVEIFFRTLTPTTS
ncbi:MAG: HD domain-containing phosphohydrolase, partial [Anaerolineae bacterium]